jgi:integrase
MDSVQAKVHAADPTKTGARAANGARSLIGKMWKKAALWGLTDYPSPVPMVPARKKTERDRYLLEDEMRRFMAAVRECENPVVRDAVPLILFTGARKTNVLAMEWSEVDFVERLWTIPREKYKGKRDHRVPLVDSALEILRRRYEQREKHAQFVFSARWGWKGYVTNIHTAGWAEIVRAANIKDFWVHDLRRTASTWALNEDESEGPIVTKEMIGAWIGHKSKDVTGIYAKVSLKLARRAAEAAEAAIRRVTME